MSNTEDTTQQEHERVLALIRAEFDEAYYRKQKPALPLEADAFDDFCASGWRDGLDPCEWFSINGYIKMHPDVRRAGMNPFEHYIVFGRKEGRVVLSPRSSSTLVTMPGRIAARRLTLQLETGGSRDDTYGPFRGVTMTPRLQSSARAPGATAIVKGISIVILTLNQFHYIQPLVTQLLRARAELANENIDVEIVIGDTGTTDEEVLEFYDEIKGSVFLFKNMLYHFSANNNILFRHTSHDVVLFLNNDIIIPHPVSVLRLILQRFLDISDIGALGAYLYFQNGTVQHAGVRIARIGPDRTTAYHFAGGENLLRPSFGYTQRVPAVTGAFLATRRDTFQRLDGFDDDYAEECQDIDFCLRLHRIGLTNYLMYAGDIVHFENGTRAKRSVNSGDRQRLARKWASYVESADL